MLTSKPQVAMVQCTENDQALRHEFLKNVVQAGKGYSAGRVGAKGKEISQDRKHDTEPRRHLRKMQKLKTISLGYIIFSAWESSRVSRQSRVNPKSTVLGLCQENAGHWAETGRDRKVGKCVTAGQRPSQLSCFT